jgi:hypothetical protein
MIIRFSNGEKDFEIDVTEEELKKIRRQLEDRIRKDNRLMLQIAQQAGLI